MGLESFKGEDFSGKGRCLVAPSILSADFSCLGEEIKAVESGGCDMIHVDVMDGHFVPNLTIGPPVVRSIRKVTKLPLDVHLMIEEPSRYLEDFQKAGADWLTFHVEAIQEKSEALRGIKSAGMKCGLSLRPGTPVESLESFLPEVDLVLVMSVEPGFGGQSFMPEMMEKVRWLRSRKFPGLISVDGGINAETAALARKAGADILVAGTAVFGAEDRSEAIRHLRNN